MNKITYLIIFYLHKNMCVYLSFKFINMSNPIIFPKLVLLAISNMTL